MLEDSRSHGLVVCWSTVSKLTGRLRAASSTFRAGCAEFALPRKQPAALVDRSFLLLFSSTFDARLENDGSWKVGRSKAPTVRRRDSVDFTEIELCQTEFQRQPFPTTSRPNALGSAAGDLSKRRIGFRGSETLSPPGFHEQADPGHWRLSGSTEQARPICRNGGAK